MTAKTPSNWYPLDDLDRWYRRRCGNYEVRRVPTLDCYATEALHTPVEGPVVRLGVFSSMPMAMAECRAHKDALESALCMDIHAGRNTSPVVTISGRPRHQGKGSDRSLTTGQHSAAGAGVE